MKISAYDEITCARPICDGMVGMMWFAGTFGHKQLCESSPQVGLDLYPW